MCHVLIIEDDALVAIELEACLAQSGATSFALAETEVDAVAEARRRPPRLITSDVMLRAGSGPSAVAQIQAELGDIPVLFITGTPSACQAGPSTRVFEKPLNDAAIGRAFRDLIDLS